MKTITINGYEHDTHCEHCGRSLRHGIKTSELGVIGADCFVSMVQKNLNRWSGGKPSASRIQELAKWMEFATESKRLRNGLQPTMFIFEVNNENALTSKKYKSFILETFDQM